MRERWWKTVIQIFFHESGQTGWKWTNRFFTGTCWPSKESQEWAKPFSVLMQIRYAAEETILHAPRGCARMHELPLWYRRALLTKYRSTRAVVKQAPVKSQFLWCVLCRYYQHQHQDTQHIFWALLCCAPPAHPWHLCDLARFESIWFKLPKSFLG